MENDFIARVCRKWKLPWVQTAGKILHSQEDIQVLPHPLPKRCKKACVLQDDGSFIPEIDPHFQDLWVQSRTNAEHTFQIVVDCKPLKQVLCGHLALERDACRPVFERMAERMFNLYDLGLHPPSNLEDPVLWVRRHLNRQADALCNAAMDARRDWRRTWPAPSCLESGKYGILAFSDGGYRGPNQAAIGWTIYLVDTSGSTILIEPLAAEAKFVSEGIHDSFLAEGLALDACIEHIHKYIRRRKGASG